MIEIYSSQSLKNFLEQVYASRHSKNGSYSYRAFARDLNLTPSHLTDILNRDTGISADKANSIADALKLTEKERELLWCLVEKDHGLNEAIRNSAAEKLKKLRTQKLALSKFDVISEWYHLAILELLLVKDVGPEQFSEYLGISEEAAAAAIQKLLTLGLLKESGGKLELTHQLLEVGDEVPSTAIRNSHKAILAKAAKAIDEQPVEKRDYSSNFIAIDLNKISEAKQCLDDFIRGFVAEFGSGSSKDELYCFSSQFFSLKNSVAEVS